MFYVDSTNQTVIINESTSSDGSTAAQLRQQAMQLTAASIAPQPIITSTSSAPDVFYTEPRLPGISGYHDDSGIAAEAAHNAKSSYVRFDEGGSVVPARQNWTVTPNRQEVVMQARVPAYRPAPDYDSVMQQRLLSQYYPTYVHPYLGPDCTSFSQPDIYQHSAMVGQWNVGGARVPASTVQGGHGGVDRASSLVIHPEVAAVARHASAAGSIVPRPGQYLYYRVPPPYPRQSSSTPDLASPTKLGVVLAHHGLDPQPRYLTPDAAQSQFDESLENIAAEVQQLQVYGLRSVDHGYHLPSVDNSMVQLGQSGVAVHPGNIMSGYYGHSVSNAGVRFDHRNGEANRLGYLQFDEYVATYFVHSVKELFHYVDNHTVIDL